MATIKSLTKNARGNALVTVILVILVLTIVGLAIAYFTQIEDRLSGNTRMQNAGFYAADSGLRKGESIIRIALNNGTATMSGLLGYVSGVTPPLQVPGGGNPAVILSAADPEDGVVKEFLNIQIPAVSAVVDRTQYSLYVRNNTEDFAPGDATHDNDNIIDLISVGQVVLPGGAGITMTSIVEEQILISQTGNEAGGMKGLNAGGTGSVLLRAP